MLKKVSQMKISVTFLSYHFPFLCVLATVYPFVSYLSRQSTLHLNVSKKGELSCMTTRKVILYIATSIDGFIADSNGEIAWLDTGVKNEEVDTSYDHFYQQVDTVILGRTTFDQVTTELSPNYYPYADSITYCLTSQKRENTDKIIFTDQSIVDLVKQLKKSNGRDIFIVGGASIIQPLVERNLIDEYILATIPIILGKGIPLFHPIKNPVALKPISTQLLNHIIYRTYQK